MDDGGGHDYITFGWIATIIGVLLFAALGQSYSTSKHQSSYYAERCARQYPDSPFAASNIHSSAGKPEAQPADNGQKAQPDWCDLAVQQSVAEDTAGMHWASWAGVVFTVIGIFFIWRTLAANTAAVQEARAANQIARETAERQLRAYVLSANCTMEIAANNEPIAHVRIQNFGQTPAFDVRSWISIWVEAFPKVVEFPDAPDDLQMAKGIKGPGFHGTFRHRRELPIKPWELAEIEEKKAAVYVYGLIEYTDCFGNKRRTKFLRFFYGKYDPAMRDNMHEYMEGNEAD